MNNQKIHWAKVQEVSFITGMKLMLSIYMLLGRRIFSIILSIVVLFYYIVSPLARKSSRDYLERLASYGRNPQESNSALNVLRHFHSFGQSILDKLAVWADTEILGNVYFPNRNLLMSQVATGTGGVLLSGHIGNMEICRSLSRNNPQMRLKILVHTKHATKFNAFLAEVDVPSELELIEVTDFLPSTMLHLAEAVKNGYFIGIMADRIPVNSSSRVVSAKFLGESAHFPIGPYVLAMLLGCPVYTMFCLLNDGGDYEIICKKFADRVVLPRGNRDEALSSYAQEFSTILEEQVIRYPRQWFNFYPFWDKS